MTADTHWLDRWAQGTTGWHRDAPNPELVQHVPSSWRRVLVPLCGASLDLGWLVDSGREVVGAELSDIAARKVFADRGVTPELVKVGEFQRFSDGALTVYVGDFFALTSELLDTTFDGVWDRAALIALPPDLRERYVDIQRQLAPGAELLLSTLDYEPGALTGPPHAVSPGEVQDLLPGAELLADQDIGDEMIARGSTGWFRSRLYRAVL